MKKLPIDFGKLNSFKRLPTAQEFKLNRMEQVLMNGFNDNIEFLRSGGKLGISGIILSTAKEVIEILKGLRERFDKKVNEGVIMDFSPVIVPGMDGVYADIGISLLEPRKQLNSKYFNLSQEILYKLNVDPKELVTNVRKQINPKFFNKDRLKELIKQEENRGYKFFVTKQVLNLPGDLPEKIFKLWTTYFGTPEELVRFDMKELTNNEIPVYYVMKEDKVIGALVIYPFGKGLPDNVYHSIRWTKKRGDNFDFSALIAYSLLKHLEIENKDNIIVVTNANTVTALKSAGKIFKVKNPLFNKDSTSGLIPIKRFDGISPFNGIYHFVTLQIEL